MKTSLFERSKQPTTTMKCLVHIALFLFLILLLDSTDSFSANVPPSTRMAMSQHLLVSNETWRQYTHVVQDVMIRPRVTQKIDPLLLKPVQEYLLSQNCSMTRVENHDHHHQMTITTTTPHEQLQQQRLDFQQAHPHWTSPSQYDYLTRCLAYVADVSAKTQSRGAALVAWHKIKECGMLPKEGTLSTFLYALSRRRLTEEEEEEDDHDDSEQVATFHDTFYAPNEKTVTLRIQSLIARKDPVAAELLLMSLPWQKLRTCWPILHYYCHAAATAEKNATTALAALVSALRLFRHMRTAPGVILDADVYGLLLSTMARSGVFLTESKIRLEGIQEYGFHATGGTELWNQLATEMADDLLELTPSAAQQIAQGFLDDSSSGNSISNSPDEDAMQTVLVNDTLILGRVLIDATTGKCPVTGVTLRLMALTPLQRQQVHDTLLEMAGAQHEEYGAKLHARGKTKDEKRNGRYAQEQLRQFSEWLKHRETPYTAIVDGPNVAYFGHGSVHYSQVLEVVQELKRIGERPLVVMPQKYVSRSFWLSGLGKVQELNDQDQAIIDKLQDCMYVVSSTCLDDYYWMLASVAEQATNNGMTPPPTIEQNEQPFQLTGLRPLLITNDQMRDHRLTLLEPRLFRRWTSCHIVNYVLRTCEEKDDDGGECKGNSSQECSYETKFFPAKVFSGEIQGNAIEGTDTMVWHFPVSEWSESERFCVCLRK